MEKGFSVVVKDSDGVKVTMTFDLLISNNRKPGSRAELPAL